MKKRLNWEEYALRLAEAAAERSEDPYIQVGACALSHDNRVLGVAYNGLAAGKNVSQDFWKDRDQRRPYMLHAEQNLLSLFGRNEARLIAVTLMPCTDCAKLICTWGIKKVCYRTNYNSSEASKIFDFYGVELIKI